MYLPKVFQYSTKSERVLLKPPFVVFFIIFFKHRLSELDIPKVDNVYYEFTKSSGKLENFRVLLQSIATKISEQCLEHIFHGKKKVRQKSLDEQVEPNPNILKMKIKEVRLVAVSRTCSKRRRYLFIICKNDQEVY